MMRYRVDMLIRRVSLASVIVVAGNEEDAKELAMWDEEDNWNESDPAVERMEVTSIKEVD